MTYQASRHSVLGILFSIAVIISVLYPSSRVSGQSVGTSNRPKPPEVIAYYGSIFAGSTASIADATRGGGIVGASIGGLVAHRSLRAFTFPGFDMELAAVRPVQPGSALDGIFSFNLQPAWTNKSNTVAPYLTAGYSRVFVSGNAINFGSGINLLTKAMADHHYFVRIEARDYYTFATQRQHLVNLRVAFCFGIPDD
jgi:hypothetical protein